jgi:flagellar biosynthesis regulator FlbT
MPDPTLSRDKVIKDLKDDISKHRQEGNYYKVLKRMFSLYVMDKNMEQVEFLISIFKF